jgi:hypothetical protein
VTAYRPYSLHFIVLLVAPFALIAPCCLDSDASLFASIPMVCLVDSGLAALRGCHTLNAIKLFV